ncbi:SDR family NAD(P)-dependent oxidoreductase [Uliginosibacterium aquaticum]|uniref:SDR family NAD(P)-dependent oxidoreductase n=1 Tax=Uliginosibacterium aquaticum TaxID=2731212 RepID=A0ABX2IKH5_9RHOO|nr:SDR family NAD(P)-dependent oxidoreductase [Uliginosibacterium aquaticum]NSL54555.1 SDR family NAD(P)-dependent oxidoreductase [Uliginosibacterium aquaticum]
MKRDKRLNGFHPVDSNSSLAGKQVVIVGGTGGIGRALSRHLARRGAGVTVVGQTFRDADVSGIQFIKADLSLMSEAERVASLLPAETLDLLIFTAGIFAAPQRQETPEGIERDLAVSFLNRFVMLQAMAPRLGSQRKSGDRKPRVFVMGYPGTGEIGSPEDLNAERSYKVMAAHMNTVVGNEMLVLDAARRYPQAAFFGLNPGLIKTNIRDNLFGKNSLKSRLMEGLIGLFTPTAEAYATRITPLLLAPEIDTHSGAMFNSKGQAILPSVGLTPEYIGRFLSACDSLLARKGLRHNEA